MQVAQTALAGVKAQRKEAVATVVDRIREIEKEQGVTREALQEIREVLYRLAARKEIFPEEDFPPDKQRDGYFPLYRMSEDPDHRFAMYMSVSVGEKNTPPHDHTTWAVIVAVQGTEENRFYRRLDDGSDPAVGRLERAGGETVRPGTGVCLMPDDIHSIHPRNETPSLQIHMYGLGLEQLTERVMYDLEAGARRTFPIMTQIVDEP